MGKVGHRLAFRSRVLAERSLEHEQRGSGFFVGPTQEWFSDSWKGLAYPALALYRINPETFDIAAKSPTVYDSLRDLDRRPSDGALAGCGWRKVFVFDPTSLAITNRIAGLGEGLECVAFDGEGDHLLIASTLRQSVRVVDTQTWRVVATKRLGRFTHARRARGRHQLVLSHGPTGRVMWFDCAELRRVHEIHAPPFGGVVQSESAIFLAIGTPKPMGFVPESHAQQFVTTSGESPASGYAPMAGTEQVTAGTGVVVVDLIKRTVSPAFPTDSLGPAPHRMIQLSRSAGRLFAFSEERIRILTTPTLKVEAEWTLPDGSFPLAVFGEGERAIVAFGRWMWSRIALVEPFPPDERASPKSAWTKLLRP